MKSKIFESLVKNNNTIVKVNQNNERLETKEQFIDDMLQRETAENIFDCLQEVTEIKAEYNTEWSMIRFYCSTIKGLNDALFVERVVKTLTDVRECNQETIQQLKDLKTRYLADFANYLYK